MTLSLKATLKMGDNRLMTLRPRTAKRFAEVLTYLHAALAIFGAVSIPLMLYFPETKQGVLYFAILVFASWIFFWDCPLTTWEQKLRRHFDPKTTYRTTFLRHYLKKKFEIPISEKTEEIVAVAYLITIFVVSLT